MIQALPHRDANEVEIPGRGRRGGGGEASGQCSPGSEDEALRLYSGNGRARRGRTGIKRTAILPPGLQRPSEGAFPTY